MTKDHAPELEELFHAMLDLPEADRARFLDERCAGAPDLRRELEALLSHDSEVKDDFLRPPFDDHQDAVHRSGDVIAGRYVLKEIIGAGGMGIVWLAGQDNPKRDVALKLIRPALASERMLRRFQQEVSLLGRLGHPGIAQIHEAGVFDDGGGARPFFAMELVEGSNLIEHVRDRELDVAERLELFEQICAAVHHAHEKGVVHRDLKPGNILVDAGGRPRILDFGVARATDSDLQLTTMRTLPGQLVGTLPYMSPEQVDGRADRIDARSDVYALGVILYELLADRLPYDLDGSTIAQTARTITEVEPLPLSSVNRVYRGDLNTIVLKALEKDPDRRYPSAADLQADVRRFRHREPIIARRASTWYQFNRFARRNTGLVAGIVIAFLVLVLGIAGTSWALVQATLQRNEARQQTEIARAVNRFLDDMLTAADPWRSESASRVHEVTVLQTLNTVAATIGPHFADQPETEAAIRLTIGRTYLHLGAYESAREHLEAGLAARQRVADGEAVALAPFHAALGLLDMQFGEYEESERHHRIALEHRRQALGESHPDTIASMNLLGMLHKTRGEYEQAESLYRRALEIQTTAGRSHDVETLAVMGNLGLLYERLGRYDEAETLLRDELERTRSRYSDEHPAVLSSTGNLASLYVSQGRYAEAAPLMEQVLAGRRRVFDDQHPQVLVAMNNLAIVCSRLGKYDRAEELQRAELDATRTLHGDESPETLKSMHNLGMLMLRQERYAEAEELLAAALDGRMRALGEAHEDTIATMSALAGVCSATERLDEAASLYERSLVLQRRVYGEEHPQTLVLMNNLAMLQLRLEDYERSAELYAEVVQRAEAVLPEGHVNVALFRMGYGRCLTVLGRFEDAEQELLTAHERVLEVLGAAHPTTGAVRSLLRDLYVKWEKPQRAEAWEE